MIQQAIWIEDVAGLSRGKRISEFDDRIFFRPVGGTNPGVRGKTDIGKVKTTTALECSNSHVDIRKVSNHILGVSLPRPVLGIRYH